MIYFDFKNIYYHLFIFFGEIYKKIIKRTKKYHAHDENNSYKKGDTVTIQETKPISKLKSWVVQEITLGANKTT